MKRAFTLTEVAVAMVILTIAALGGLGYQYHAARHAQIARVEIIGTRTAQLLLEDWKSQSDSKDYDPYILGLGFSPRYNSFEFIGSGCNNFGEFFTDITVDNVPMKIKLQWKDADCYDIDNNGIINMNEKLLELTVTVKFTKAFISPINLTTYVSPSAR